MLRLGAGALPGTTSGTHNSKLGTLQVAPNSALTAGTL